MKRIERKGRVSFAVSLVPYPSEVTAAIAAAAPASSNVFYNLRVVVHSRSYIQQEVSEGTECGLRET